MLSFYKLYPNTCSGHVGFKCIFCGWNDIKILQFTSKLWFFYHMSLGTSTRSKVGSRGRKQYVGSFCQSFCSWTCDENCVNKSEENPWSKLDLQRLGCTHSAHVGCKCKFCGWNNPKSSELGLNSLVRRSMSELLLESEFVMRILWTYRMLFINRSYMASLLYVGSTSHLFTFEYVNHVSIPVFIIHMVLQLLDFYICI